MSTRKQSDAQVREIATALFRNHRSHLLPIARQNAATLADAEEALQDAFLSFLRSFDPSGGAPPLAWLTTTLKRACWARSHRSGPARSGELGVLEAIPSTAAGPEAQMIERSEARRRLADLRPDERTVLGFQAAGFSYREIAERRGWTYTKVNRCINEGRAALAA
jgi:DNA-directed RNA polymerase specialized sigma24 family protein